MRFRLGQKISLKARLVWSYLVILGAGGLVTSIVGSWIVSSTIMTQARRAVDHDAATARTVFEERRAALETALRFAASGTTIPRYLEQRDPGALRGYLEQIRRDAGFDFVELARPGDGAPEFEAARAALSGQVVSGAEIVPKAHAHGAGFLAGEAGMALMAAAPVRGAKGEILGALYGGALLNGNFAIVDRVWDLLFRSEGPAGRESGSVTIFQDDVRISTTVKTPERGRATGTRAFPGIGEAVLQRGERWKGRAQIQGDWYIAEYDPIRSHAGRIVGMLGVGIQENAYTAIRDRVVLSFFGIATVGFLLIIGITYYMISNITRPIVEMAAATREIAAGRFDREVRSGTPGELALLAESFNAMLKSLRQMRGDLEVWGRTLEEKVRQRTEELVAMQARVAQSERLASIGLLAAGVAHEVNNPLGGILSLTALTLEDMAPGDPNRENLQVVLRQTERCRDIVRGLLEFSRQSKGTREPVDLNEVLEDSLALVGTQAMFFNVKISQRLAPGLPCVIANASQFQQVFVNILLNGVQAMNERGEITVSTRTDPETGRVEASISDTGCGIPPEQADRIFDPFFTTKESGHGTGLGLSIAYGIVTTHGGTISVRSEVGKGSVFIVSMPAAAAVRQA
jgi:two-component system, NtrC family, sensor kinase